ncbi:cob(II)yrinic acid a,c-diamide reductase [Sulfurimonas gotlandica GD1]|uniref:Cob(II)yrinic acid a,c-diamide reductase n=1 Tax=Sulfurimonas gotlandica (strain DSM 19862 / JCM 16533 / GD1) TaxID=929558 RepID=B6BH73_SULGG|nr:5,6-dimethylbenzimidazole synthase [Sulfurimonas gotlandica]EDZ63218.1 cob(II)yrinic acid a,c-diamide reductase [Sulfurimonas gotlandica GD1]EHP29862.1 cob(II)yrinic acid a,c-diamide reductase [Sulfurimonas gotlandica GD1]
MTFTKEDAQTLLNIMKSRRDVRGNRFLNEAIEDEKIELILEAGISAPSVGYSQPWKFVLIKDENIKENIHQNFVCENTKAKEIFKDSQIYKSLKLEGIKEAPINIAVLYESLENPTLGMTSMYKMGEYSVVCAIENMWLMARALDIGLGWVSILDEEKVLKTLNAPRNTQLIAYLCLGYVNEFCQEPELKTLKWKKEKSLDECVVENSWA